MAIKLHAPEDHPITCFYSGGGIIEKEEDWKAAKHVFITHDPNEARVALMSSQYADVALVSRKTGRRISF